MADNFWEAYKDPRWQRKRLEIMELRDFTCEWCGANDKTLNVHHGYYERGKMPWEYDNETLHCLCEPCHASAQETIAAIRRMVATLSASNLQEAYGYLCGVKMRLDNSLAMDKPNADSIRGVGLAWSSRPLALNRWLNQTDAARVTVPYIFAVHEEGFGLVHRDHAAELIAEIEFFKTHPYAPVGLLSNF
jgi:hypothetical protein